MFTMQIVNLLANIAVAVAGLVMAWGLLRMLDKSLGISFGSDVYPQILEGNVAAAVYFAARIVGVLLFMGACLSRVPI